MSFSESGGAGEVARRLSHFQNVLGAHSRFVFLTDSSLRKRPLALPLHSALAGIDHHLVRSHNFGAPVSLLRDLLQRSGLFEGPVPDLVHLHWINGVSTVSAVQKIFPNSALAMTLHDMNPFTGTCHYSLSCRNYKSGCQKCPAVQAPLRPLVERNLRRKNQDIGLAESLAFIAPSEWIRNCAKDSLPLRNRDITLIRNLLGSADPPKQNVRVKRDGPAIFLIIASNLDDPVKGVDWAIDALKTSHGYSWELRLVGARRNPLMDDRRFAFLGQLSQEALEKQFSEADAIIIPSTADNAPLVFGEAVAQGLFPMVRGAAGLPELISVMKNGLIFHSQQELRDSVEKFAFLDPETIAKTRSKISAQALAEFGPVHLAQQHLDLYGRLVN